MIIELHALQSFAPSNLNRDDTGNPQRGALRRRAARAHLFTIRQTRYAGIRCLQELD